MQTGAVKWFNRQEGCGFIQPEDGSSDAFVRASTVESAMERAGLASRQVGRKLSFELQHDRRGGKVAAENLWAA